MSNEPRSCSRRDNGLSVENMTEEYASRTISGELHVTKIKSRGSAIGYNKLFKVIAFICMVHASRQVALFNRLNNEDLQSDKYPMEMTAPMLRSSTIAQCQIDDTKRKRRRRTAPLPTKEGPIFSFLSQISPLDDVIGMDSTYPSFTTSFPTTDYVVGDHICGHQKKCLQHQRSCHNIRDILSSSRCRVGAHPGREMRRSSYSWALRSSTRYGKSASARVPDATNSQFAIEVRERIIGRASHL